MTSITIAKPQEAALPIEPLRDYLRLSIGFGQDNLQEGQLRHALEAALDEIARSAGLVILEREASVTLSRFASPERHSLPLFPVLTLQSATHHAENGAETPLPQLRLDPSRRALISSTQSLPSLISGQVTLRLLAGFGPSWADVPSGLQQAVLMLAASIYDSRPGGGQASSVAHLLAPYRARHISLGGQS